MILRVTIFHRGKVDFFCSQHHWGTIWHNFSGQCKDRNHVPELKRRPAGHIWLNNWKASVLRSKGLSQAGFCVAVITPSKKPTNSLHGGFITPSRGLHTHCSNDYFAHSKGRFLRMNEHTHPGNPLIFLLLVINVSVIQSESRNNVMCLRWPVPTHK